MAAARRSGYRTTLAMRAVTLFFPMALSAVLILAGCATTGRDIGPQSLALQSFAQACFAAASQRQPALVGERRCDAALADPALRQELRAATLVNRGIVAMNAGRIDAATRDFDAAIALAPDNADAHINKGVALLQVKGRAADAITVLTLALDLAPRRPELAYYHRAIANEALGRLRAAYEDYAVAAQLAPDWPEPATQLQRFKVVRRKTLSG